MIKYIKNYALIAAVAACATLAANAEVIEPVAYARSFTITFPGYRGSETLTDFPVLIKISPERNNFDYSACKVAGGADLRFADADGNLLASEVDTWNTSGESLVWVKVPSFNKDTVITAYYGNANPDSVTASDVWSNGYVGVWHLNEAAVPLAESSGKSTPFELPPSIQDRTTYATNGVAGGKAVSFDNEYYSVLNPRLQAADDPDLRGLTNFTVECWTYQTKYRGDGEYDATIIGNYMNWKLYQEANGAVCCRWRKPDGNSNVFSAKTPSALALNEWTHSTFVRNFTGESSANGTMYLNGGSVATKSESNAELTGNGSEVTQSLGAGDGIRVFPGSIDEVRVSNVARSADWIKASHDTVMEDGFALFGVAESDNDWTKYSHRFKVSFSGYTGSETLTNFPVLVKISESGLDGFHYADCKKPGGADLRFADASGNLLASEVDTWNTNGVSLVWVKVPSLTAATKITAYYGWDFAPVVAASNVWANGYVGVWHLNESAVPLKESSGVSTPFMNTSANPTYTNKVTFAANGVAGKSVSFYDNDNYQNNSGIPRLEAADDPDLDGFNSFTVEYWTFPKGTWGDEADSGIVAKREASFNLNANASWCVQQNKTTFKSYCIWSTNSTVAIKAAAASDTMPALNTWNYQTFVRDVKSAEQANLQWYFNGAADGSKSEDNPQPVNSGHATLVLGGGKGPRVFLGSIDEVRISNVARSADWVKASHDTVMGSSFATYGSARKNVETGMFLIVR